MQRSNDWKKTEGGREDWEPVGSRRTINHVVMACSHVHANIHVNLNRERAAYTVSSSLSLSPSFCTENRHVEKKKYIYLYILYAYSQSVFTLARWYQTRHRYCSRKLPRR